MHTFIITLRKAKQFAKRFFICRKQFLIILYLFFTKIKQTCHKKLFTLLVLIISITASANTIIVKGYVKDVAGKGVANRNVHITIDTLVSNSNCFISHNKFTDAYGFYTDTLTCNSDIKKLRIYTESCGIMLVNDPQVGATNIVECNFTICLPPILPTPPPIVIVPPFPVNCTGNFTFLPQLAGVKFNSNVSIVALNDTIISRKWDFGDGETNATSTDPTHTYAKSGNFNVCLTIKTSSGCENKICKIIALSDSSLPVAVSINEPVKIIRVYPNPIHFKMNTLILSFNKDVVAEVSIVDIYGIKKWSKKISLVQGNNNLEVATAALINGSYFFKVSTGFGVVSRKFYKL